MSGLKFKISQNAEDFGKKLADIIVEAYKSKKKLVLGVPWGNSPVPFFNTFSDIAKKENLDLSNLHLIIMDEYVTENNGLWSYVPTDAPYSGHYKINADFLQKLDSKQSEETNVHFPDPNNPERYETLIRELGGIDIFLVATGSDDGHVAMCGPGTPLDSKTRIVELPETIREHNFHRYQNAFENNIENVPKYGISVGLETITNAKRLIFIAHGAEKSKMVGILEKAKSFNKKYPVTFLWNAVEKTELYIDEAAAGELK